jgi:uncharacterized protein YjbI with pentapeptide repeats
MAESEHIPAADEGPADSKPKFAETENDLEALRKTVEDAASISGGLWLSYLFVLFYFAVAAGAVTHVDLLLENPVKLPFLGVELPLKAFFFLAPILFLINHAYMLVNLVILAAKTGAFQEELVKQFPGACGGAAATREGLRRQLPSNILVQFLAGPADVRKGVLGMLLKTIAWITIVIGPVLLLLMIMVQFLPYHLEWLTWTHRLVILADVLLLWALWPRVLAGRSDFRGPAFLRYKTAALASLILLGIAFTAATFPGERLDDWIGERQWIPPNPVTAWLGQEDSGNATWTSFHNLLFNSRIYRIHVSNRSLFYTTLDLTGFDVLSAKHIDDTKRLAFLDSTLILKGRHLEHADFMYANLPKVDFEWAYLSNGLFDFAQLGGAKFAGATLQGASFDFARLQGADFDKAQAQGASFDFAQLQGASFQWGTQLQGASFDFAQLQGVPLAMAQLQGASLAMAELRGASLDLTELAGASLYKARLQGASLVNTRLQGAMLDGANLSGASFFAAQFQGASLKNVKLTGASLMGPYAWRARLEPESMEGTKILNPKWGKEYYYFELDGSEHEQSDETLWTEKKYHELKETIERNVPAGVRVHAGSIVLEMYGQDAQQAGTGGLGAALKRIESLDPSKPFEFEAEASESQKRMEANTIRVHEGKYSPEELRIGKRVSEQHPKALAAVIKELVCSGDANAVYILLGRSKIDHTKSHSSDEKTGLLARIDETDGHASALVDEILEPKCPVSIELTEDDKARLRAIKTKKEAEERTARKK